MNQERPLTPAERQARYRRRIIEAGERDDANSITVDRAAHDQQVRALAELQAAIKEAAARGIPLALAASGGLDGCAAPTERIVRLAKAIRRMRK